MSARRSRGLPVATVLCIAAFPLYCIELPCLGLQALTAFLCQGKHQAFLLRAVRAADSELSHHVESPSAGPACFQWLDTVRDTPPPPFSLLPLEATCLTLDMQAWTHLDQGDMGASHIVSILERVPTAPATTFELPPAGHRVVSILGEVEMVKASITSSATRLRGSALKGH